MAASGNGRKRNGNGANGKNGDNGNGDEKSRKPTPGKWKSFQVKGGNGHTPVPQPPVSLPAQQLSTRATKAEVAERVAYTIQMVLDGRRKHEIKAFFRRQYNLSAGQVERYLRIARSKIAEVNTEDLDQMRAEFYARYMAVALKTGNDAIKLHAYRAASTLFGLDAPQKFAQTTTEGKDIHKAAVQELSVEELRVMRAVRTRMQELANGKTETN